MKITKKYLSLFLALVMLLTLSPASALAGEELSSVDDPTPCEHVWENGVCALCKAEHEEHSFEDGVCTVCGAEETDVEPKLCTEHVWEDGICTLCGAFEEAENDSPAPADDLIQNDSVSIATSNGFHFVEILDGLTVTVDAPADAFPEGTTMTAVPVYDQSILDSLINAVDAEDGRDDPAIHRSAMAVDITFYDSEGLEIQPATPIRVTFNSDAIAHADENTLVHMDSSGFTDVIDEAVATPANELAFEAEHFSVYGFVTTEIITIDYLNANNELYSIVINCDADAGIPLGAELSVEVLDPASAAYQSAYNAVVEAKRAQNAWLDESSFSLTAFDIAILKDGVELEPNDAVHVSIQLKDLGTLVADVDTNTLEMHHVKDNGSAEIVAASSQISVEGNVAAAVFETDSFSVYTVSGTVTTGRRTYEFYTTQEASTPYYFQNVNGDTIYWQIVKNGDLLQDPGIPGSASADSGAKFLGWFTVDGDVQVDFEQAVSGISTTDETVQLYPKFGQYLVSYHDEVGTVITTVVTAGGPYTLTQSYSAYETTKAFIGWSTLSTGATESDVITSVEVTGNVDLYPVLADAAWITFDAQGGTPVESVYVQNGSSISSVGVSTRLGYTFAGWYTAASGGELFANASGAVAAAYQSQSTSITVYAHWTAGTSTYSVVYWQENADDNGYSYVTTVTKSGTTGANTAGAAGAPTYTGFTRSAVAEQPIAGDGSTVVNVYYTRIIYTVYFYNVQNVAGLGYSQVSGGPYYFYFGGSGYVMGCYRYGTGPYTGGPNSSYPAHAQNGNYGSPVTTIQAKYGENIRSRWPSYSSYPLGWAPRPLCPDEMSLPLTTMPLNGGSFFYRFEFSSGNYTMVRNYYVQALNGNSNSLAGGGNSFTLHTSESFRDIYNDWVARPTMYQGVTGFTPIFQNAAAAQGVSPYVLASNVGSSQYCPAVGSSGTRSGNTYTWNLYYARNHYTIDFKNGITGAGISSKSVYYQASLATIASDITVTPPDNYEFAGWVTAPEEAGYGSAFNFNRTMPASNLVVYAKFIPTSCTVTYDPNGGTLIPPSNVTVDYGDSTIEYLSPSDIDRTGYTFVGWFKVHSDGSLSPYNFSDPVSEDITLKAVWRKLGSYSVAYDVGTGSGTITDSNMYLDQGKVTVLTAAPTPPEGKVFVGWTLTSASGSTTYKPGEQFTLDADQMDAASDGTADTIITLTARYADVETTSVILHGNTSDGSATVTVDSDATRTVSGDPVSYTPEITGSGTTDATIDKLEWNAAIDLSKVAASRLNYELVGWSTSADTSAEGFTPDGSTTFAVDDIVAVGSGVNDLYAVWGVGHFYVYHSSDHTVQTFAMTDVPTTGFNLKALVKDGFFYGGYYMDYKMKGNYAGDGEAPTSGMRDYPGGAGYWKSADSYTAAVIESGGGVGTAMTPVAGQTYYLKEVPNAFLTPYTHLIYRVNVTPANKIAHMFLMTNVDDTNYSNVGLIEEILDGSNRTKLSLSYIITTQATIDGNLVTDRKVITAKTISPSVAAGYVAVWIDDSDIKVNEEVAYRPYFVTPDGVMVEGLTSRMVYLKDTYVAESLDILTPGDHFYLQDTQ